MKISKLIKQLEKIQKKHGDIEVFLLSDSWEFERVNKTTVGYTLKGTDAFWVSDKKDSDDEQLVVALSKE